MRRRRAGLKVETFPFLAVLLCAMGSLILLMLVIDRRAKAVSHAKAVQAALKAAAERSAARSALSAEQLARQKQEWERRRQELHALLAEEDEGLQAELKAAEGKAAETAAQVKAEEARYAGLWQKLKAEEVAIAQRQQEVAARHGAVVLTAGQKEAARGEMTRLAAELAQLERTLRDLKTIRSKDEQTYSLVPYLGRRGDNRKPLYVECAAEGIIFHPDRLALRSSGATAADVRAEVERRIARYLAEARPPAGAADPGRAPPKQTLYLFCLVRPDGLESYYRLTTAMAGLDVDFGYEFIDSDWALDFSAPADNTQRTPWRASSPAKIPSAPLASGNPSVPAPPRHVVPVQRRFAEGGQQPVAWNPVAGPEGGPKPHVAERPTAYGAGLGQPALPGSGVGVGGHAEGGAGSQGFGVSSGRASPGATPGVMGLRAGGDPDNPSASGGGPGGNGIAFGIAGTGPEGGGTGVPSGGLPGMPGASGGGVPGGYGPGGGTGTAFGGAGTEHARGSRSWGNGVSLGAGGAGLSDGVAGVGGGVPGLPGQPAGRGASGPGGYGTGGGSALGSAIGTGGPTQVAAGLASGRSGLGSLGGGPNSGRAGGEPGGTAWPGGPEREPGNAFVPGGSNGPGGPGTGGGLGSNGQPTSISGGGLAGGSPSADPGFRATTGGGSGIPGSPGQLGGSGAGGSGTGSSAGLATPAQAQTLPGRQAGMPGVPQTGAPGAAGTGGGGAPGQAGGGWASQGVATVQPGQPGTPASGAVPGAALSPQPGGLSSGGADGGAGPPQQPYPTVAMPGLVTPVAPPGQPRRGPRGLASGGGPPGQGDSGPGGPPDVMASLGPPAVGGRPGPRRPAPSLPLSYILGNRDWNILIECESGKLTVHSTKQEFSTAALQRGDDRVLVESVRQLIARRQAAVRPGEPPYRPVLRFRVHQDGLRCYYTACSSLECLRVPMARENLEDAASGIPGLSRD